MDTSVRDIKIGLGISPVFWQDMPKVHISFNDSIWHSGPLDKSTQFSYLLPASDHNRLSVKFTNKTDNDTLDNKDKAVIIDYVEIESYRYNSFIYQSKYYPIYSSGYYDYAKANNLEVKDVLKSATYLGFNGEWILDIPWPTFTWIHQLETNGQGWIYEKNI